MKNHLRVIMIAFVLFITHDLTGWAAERFDTPTSLERAKEMLTANKPAEALAALSSYLPSHEERSAYHYALARALVALKRPYDSIENYRLAYVYADALADKERILLERADVYAAMGYYPEAAVCYDVFLKQFPKSRLLERVELGIAEARFKNGDFRQALAHYDKAGTSVRVVMGKANTLQALGRTAEARDLYQALIEDDPEVVNSSPETLFWVGENFRQAGNRKDARFYFESVKDPILKYRAAQGLGLLALEEANYNAAIMQFSIAAESPERTVRRDAILNRADAQMRMGKYDDAQAALEEIRNKYPYGKQADTAVLLLAQLLRKKGKSAEAAALLNPLIYRRDPLSSALDELEAMLLEAKDRDPKEFVTLWMRSGRWLLDPSREKFIVDMAQALRREGKPFLDICAWLIKYGSESGKSDGRLLLAGFYADLGDGVTAGTYLKRAKSKGHHDEVARVKAQILMAGMDFKNASEAIMTIRDINETDMLHLIDAMNSLKSKGKATAFLDQIFRKKSISPGILIRFADELFDTGQRPKALEYYRQATTVKPAQDGKDGVAEDVEWAHYRMSVIAKGRDGADSLKTIQSAKNAIGRFAAAELKGAELRRKVD